MRGSTWLGLGAVVLWSSLALLTALAGAIPPFQLAAMTFAVGSFVGLVWCWLRGQSPRLLAQVPGGAWVLGIYGLLGFHVCYFFALQAAPVLEASLIVYLWPLLMVLFTGFLPAGAGGGRLRWWHVAGAGLGFAGTIVILLQSAGRPQFGGMLAGLAMAFGAAVIWSSYSVASRLFASVPGIAVAGCCAITAVASVFLHLALETPVQPAGATAWLAILGLGLGPVGLAFFLWDEGMKAGDIRLLGVASYATPLLSTLILAAAGFGTASAGLWFAAGLITAGALLASRETIRGRP